MYLYKADTISTLFEEISNDLEKVFKSTFNDKVEQRGNSEIRHEKDFSIIEIEVPGVLKENISIEYIDTIITISYNKKEKKETRRFHLQNLDLGKAESKLENGILIIKIPNSEKAKPKKIEIK